MPQAKVYEVMFKGDHKWRTAQKWLQDLRDEVDSDPNATYSLEQLSMLLLKFREPVKPYSFFEPSKNLAEERAKQACLEEIASISLRIGRMSLFDEALSELDGGLPLNCFFALGGCITPNDLLHVKTRYYTLERHISTDLVLTPTQRATRDRRAQWYSG